MSDFRIIYTRPEDGGVSVVIPAPGVELEEALKAVPEGLEYSIIDKSAQPDRVFRNAWIKNGNSLIEDLVKCKEIAHGKRRFARDEEFKPYDEIIAKQIPGNDHNQAENARQQIRDKYALMQTNIDNCSTVQELRTCIADIIDKPQKI